MNIFTTPPIELIGFVMSELSQAKRPRMVFIDQRGNLDVHRADSLAGIHRYQRTPHHWVGTWDGRARRAEVAYCLFAEVARLVQPRQAQTPRGAPPAGPYAAGSLPVTAADILRGAA